MPETETTKEHDMRPRPTDDKLKSKRKAGHITRVHRAVLAATLGTVATAACLVALSPTIASGDTGTSGNGGESASCPATNPPNELTLAAGTPQITTVDTGFATTLQVALDNSNGCPVTDVAGTPITFSAPSSGASGVFSESDANSVTVGSDSSGNASAPTFTANDIAGIYTVTASSQYGSITFYLTNTATGVPATIVPVSPSSSSAKVSSNYAQPLSAKVLDANGNPVTGATVTFTLAAATATKCGQSTAATATFTADAGTQATATTDGAGIASSPLLMANGASGTFTATAAVSSFTADNGGTPSSGDGSAGAATNANADTQTAPSTPAPLSFTLTNLPGQPQLTAGAGLTQSAAVRGRFPIRLHVTVTDADSNPVAGAPVTFTAPKTGPSGRFTTGHRDRQTGRSHTTRRRVVVVKSNGCGIAVAPTFDANDRAGAYIVKASESRARSATFALLNMRRRER